ncbi:MAG TPA: AMP-binding protein [Acidobacteriaceae bacterium]|jgi:phenylacetate-coenzyme A ligase PaaK-like adenylate-forming protein|nr:AMP-binding protein [Acidobacteriaceae bacterium]
MTAADIVLDRNPLDAWASQRAGIALKDCTRETIADYQLRAIRQTVAWVRDQSSFYAARLAAFPAGWPGSLEEFAHAPLTSPADIADRAPEFLCVPQSEISRVVTLESSGTTGARKRIFFSAEDQDQTLDFFAHGVASMGAEGDRMFIALPGEREGSVGFQLARAVARAGIVPVPHGLITDPLEALRRMDEERATLAIGLPTQMLAVALQAGDLARRAFRYMHTIVLCSDHVPQSLVDRIAQATGCELFEHYGSTEMGLGGGVDCRVRAGYHLREADLFFEIVSPQTGEPLPHGHIGEVVFTTLGRRGMPLLRYRTGDLSRILPDPCPCGSPLRRLARIENRVDSTIALGPHGSITIAALDEALFAIAGVHDFTAALIGGTPNALHLNVCAPRARKSIVTEVKRALMHLPAIAANCDAALLRLVLSRQTEFFPVTGAKRAIRVQIP